MKSWFNTLFLVTMLTLVQCLATDSDCFAASPTNNPVPGGIVVVPLSGDAGEKPEVRFGDKNIYVTTRNSDWVAVVGLPHDMLPGKYILTFRTTSEKNLKKSFRIEPLPASLSQRTVNLPENLKSLEFLPMDSMTYNRLTEINPGFDAPVEPDFNFYQMVNSGSYIPYGWLINKFGPTNIIGHSWITFITSVDEIVNAPATGLVEKIFLSENSGLTVVLNHGEGMKSIVSYLNDTILKPGEAIESGDVIGTTKTILDSDGSEIGRVDWQLMLNGYFIDPLQFTPAS